MRKRYDSNCAKSYASDVRTQIERHVMPQINRKVMPQNDRRVKTDIKGKVMFKLCERKMGLQLREKLRLRRKDAH